MQGVAPFVLDREARTLILREEQAEALHVNVADATTTFQSRIRRIGDDPNRYFVDDRHRPGQRLGERNTRFAEQRT
ncbi:hypothetical protein [Caballeronia mineralivorans]|uniref:hypothetical protein n=1 Tax=Caballeronia mineralivorans TaxID=2010198 RepID=UPI001F42B868|nr:hypothetical protein [Caballeronia mineralivorans]